MRRCLLALLLSLATLSCTASRALAADDEPRALLDRARAEFFGGRFDRARALLSRVLVNPTLTSPQRARAHMTLGLIEEAGGRRERALAHFRRALSLDGTLTLDAKRFKPSVVALWQQAKTPTPTAPARPPVKTPPKRAAKPTRAPAPPPDNATTATTTTPDDTRDARGGFGYLWTTIGAGATVATLAAAIALGVSAQSKRDQGCELLREAGYASCEPASTPALDADRYGRYVALQQSVDRRRVASNVLYSISAVGAALTAVALVLELRAARRGRQDARRDVSLGLGLGPGSALLQARITLP